MAENIAYISAIAFGTVTDENFARLHKYPSAGIIILDDSVDQERITLFGTVAVEILLGCQVVDGFVHRFDNGWCQWLCYITDSHADYFFFRVRYLETVYFFRNVRKQVTVL